MIDDRLFEVSPRLGIHFEPIADGLPVLIIDNFYLHADELRSQALTLQFGPAHRAYPGRVAPLTSAGETLTSLLIRLLGIVNRRYLPRLPATQRIGDLTQAITDFAIVDLHPSDLGRHQRVPHVDPAPIFGLVYLNHEDRGGTLFFRRSGDRSAATPAPGYPTHSGDGFELVGRIAPAFNRLVVYPGFVPHSGEIAGDWITSDERFTSPRLTQWIIFRISDPQPRSPARLGGGAAIGGGGGGATFID